MRTQPTVLSLALEFNEATSSASTVLPIVIPKLMPATPGPS